MQRVRLTTPGFDRPLHWEPDAPAPDAPTADRVLIAVEACGVCHRDLIDRAGRFPFLQLPVTPGHEAVGRVVAVGPSVTRWAVGDRVATLHRDSCGSCDACAGGDTSLCEAAAWIFGLVADGGYASHLVAPERALYRVPNHVPAAEAAILHCTWGSAWRGLVTVGGMVAGERVLVTGANGGVGLAGVRIASERGATVIAVIRDPRHEALVRSQGAHEVIVDADGRFHKDTRALGVHLALETVGEPTFNASLRCLRPGGRLAVVGNVTEARAALNLGQVVVRGVRILGPGGATARDMAAILEHRANHPGPLPVDRVLPLAQADAAHEALRGGGLTGRVVLVPG